MTTGQMKITFTIVTFTAVAITTKRIKNISATQYLTYVCDLLRFEYPVKYVGCRVV